MEPWQVRRRSPSGDRWTVGYARSPRRENYDNRIDNGDLLDLEVLADLRLRYPASEE